MKLQGIKQSGVVGDGGTRHSCALKKGAQSEKFGGEIGGNFPYWPVGSDEQRSMNTHCATPVKENGTQRKRTVNEGGISQRRTSANQ